MKTIVVFLLAGLCALAEVRTMTLRQALELALNQNPDLTLARLDQQKAREQVTEAHDPFVPKVIAGSGAAWTNGFPMSIDGNAPAIFQAKTNMAIFNRPQSYQVARANEGVRTAEIGVGARQDEIAYRIATLFLDAEQASQSLGAAQRQSDNLARVRQLTEARVEEGQSLAVATKKANLAVLKARQRVEQLNLDLIQAETSLALVLGLGPDDRVRAATEERAALEMPESEERSIEQALDGSRELKRLESELQMKTLEIRGYHAERLPKISLIAQYALLGKYNNYQDYFNRFKRSNWELGAAFEIPLLVGRAPSALAAQSEADAAKLRVEVGRTRTRITADLRRAYLDIRRAETSREVARADLDVTREELNNGIAQMEEGRLAVARVEEMRAEENEKWLALYASQHALELARLNVLRQTGTLMAALR
jgi:outer membrane protein